MTTGHLAGESDRPVNNDGHRTERIRSLNDALRQKLPRAVKGCRLNVTSGVAALHPDALARLLDSVRSFADFAEDNDPHGEHGFGAIDQEGTRFLWKIDCYDDGCSLVR